MHFFVKIISLCFLGIFGLNETNHLSALQISPTYSQVRGNKWVAGKGALPTLLPLDIPVNGRPLWIIGIPLEKGSEWIVTLDSGKVEHFSVHERKVQLLPERTLSSLPTPPYAFRRNGITTLATSPSRHAAPWTHPVFLPRQQTLAFLEENGDLVLWDQKEKGRLSLNALPDARILVDRDDRLLVLTHPSERYGHGVLGDGVEATGITLVQTQPTLKILNTIRIAAPTVIEGISPLWEDLDGDGQQEIIVTESNRTQGAQLVVYDEDGKRKAEGEPIGKGYRWRHQLAVAPFGPQGEIEIVDVLTPHLGGIVEFFQLKGTRLVKTASTQGYTSHRMGSRNLDMAIAGDFDGDSTIELLLPNQRRTSLNAIGHTLRGAKRQWSLPVDGHLTTNIAAITFPNQSIAVGIGHDRKKIRLWLPQE